MITGKAEIASDKQNYDSAKIENELKYLQIEKIKEEISKIKIESLEITRSSWLKPSNILSVVVGLVGLSSAITQYVHDENRMKIITERHKLEQKELQIKLDETKKELNNVEVELTNKRKIMDLTQSDFELASQDLEEMRSLISIKQNELQNANDQLTKIQIKMEHVMLTANLEPQVGDQIAALTNDAKLAAEQITLQSLRSLVYIQFRGTLKRSLMRQLQSKLQEENYQTPSLERKAGQYNNNILYFFPEDLESAKKASTIVNDFFSINNCSIFPKIMPVLASPETQSSPPPRGQIKILIHHSCD